MQQPIRDLHLHSNCSDGLLDPGALVEYAARCGVQELSLTDHDTLAGLDEAQRTARALGMRFVPGIELTCRFLDRVVHVLGYGFHPDLAQADEALTSYLQRVRDRDHQWAAEVCRKSGEDPLVLRTPTGEVHRVCVHPEELGWVRGTMPSGFHIAMVLARKLAAISDELDHPARHYQYVFFGRLEASRQQESYWPELRPRYAPLLQRYGLATHTRWWVPRPTDELLAVEDALAAIQRIGGIGVIAHPGEQRLQAEHIRALAELGVRGVEIYTFKHDDRFIAELEVLAQSLGLFATSGTDFHDPHHRAQVELGRDRDGGYLIKGVSLDDLGALGAYVSEPA